MSAIGGSPIQAGLTVASPLTQFTDKSIKDRATDKHEDRKEMLPFEGNPLYRLVNESAQRHIHEAREFLERQELLKKQQQEAEAEKQAREEALQQASRNLLQSSDQASESHAPGLEPEATANEVHAAPKSEEPAHRFTEAPESEDGHLVDVFA